MYLLPFVCIQYFIPCNVCKEGTAIGTITNINMKELVYVGRISWLLLLSSSSSYGFLGDNSQRTGVSVHHQSSSWSPKNPQPVYLSEEMPLVGEDCVSLAGSDSQTILESLRERQNDLDKGIGKRYICRTQRGFLNVHKEPGDPFNTDNIVAQLQEGDIVTSTGPPRGPWIPHDSGGWSISIYSGFTWLEPLKE